VEASNPKQVIKSTKPKLENPLKPKVEPIKPKVELKPKVEPNPKTDLSPTIKNALNESNWFSRMSELHSDGSILRRNNIRFGVKLQKKE
jgi:hypothetical protein